MPFTEKTAIRRVLAENLRFYMEKAGVESLRQLRDASGVSQSMISHMLNQKVDPRTTTLSKLAQALNIHESLLLDRTGENAKMSEDDVFLMQMGIKYRSLSDDAQAVARWVIFGSLAA